MMRRNHILTFIMAVVASTQVRAQVPNGGARIISGQIVDSVTGRPLRDALLYFDVYRTDRKSDADGRFSIESQGPKDTLLVIAHIGYVPLHVPLRDSGNARVDLGKVALRPVATLLDRIAVEVEEVRVYPQLAEFYRRKQQGGKGTFLTDADIRNARARKASDLLEQSVSAKVECPPDPVRSGDECTVRSARGRDVRIAGSRQLGQSGQSESGFDNRRCEMDVVVDGIRATMKIDEIPVQSIAAIEVYSGPATAPAIYGNARCGVVVIWTKKQ